MAAKNKETLILHNERLDDIQDDLSTLPKVENLEGPVSTQEELIAEILNVLAFKGVEVAQQFSYTDTDLTEDAELEEGKLHFVYGNKDIDTDIELEEGKLYLVYK